MIEETVAGRLLANPRGGEPGDINAVVELILKVADLALSAPELSEFELNPVIVHPAGYGATVVDARAILLPTSDL